MQKDNYKNIPYEKGSAQKYLSVCLSSDICYLSVGRPQLFMSCRSGRDEL